MLNAVFALHYLNRRFHRQNLYDGVVPIELHEALSDLWSADQIEAAIARSDTLINDGMNYEWRPDKTTQHLDELAAGHPGFSLSNLHAAWTGGTRETDESAQIHKAQTRDVSEPISLKTLGFQDNL